MIQNQKRHYLNTQKSLVSSKQTEGKKVISRYKIKTTKCVYNAVFDIGERNECVLPVSFSFSHATILKELTVKGLTVKQKWMGKVHVFRCVCIICMRVFSQVLFLVDEFVNLKFLFFWVFFFFQVDTTKLPIINFLMTDDCNVIWPKYRHPFLYRY